MYLEHFGLSEVPFRITPHTEFFYYGANRGATLNALIYAIVHDEGIVKVSGEVGSGKTMLCRVLVESLPPHVVIVYLSNPSLSRDDILFAIAADLDLNLPLNARTSAVVRALHEKLIDLHGQGRQVVVLIDEAHAMPMETLEEIRLLSNLETSHHKLLQLVMFGQPELDQTLARSDMRQLKERITQHFTLEPMRQDDIAEYIEFRMRTAGYKGPQPFTPGAIKLIASASLGLTRRVNILAEKSLLAAFADGRHEITQKEVAAAIRDTAYDHPRAAMWRKVAIAVAVVATIAVAATLVAVFGNGSAQRMPAPANAAVAPAPVAPSPPVAEEPVAAAPASPGSGTEPAPDGVSPRLTFPAAAATVAAIPKTALAAAAARLSPAAQQRLLETRQWIDATDSRRWFIQLVTTDTSQIDYAQNYLTMADRLLKPEHARLYMADTGREQRIGIIHGEFPSMGAAYAAIEKLPPELRTNSPFPRQVLWLE